MPTALITLCAVIITLIVTSLFTRSRSTANGTSPALTAADISAAVASQFNTALEQLTDRARIDRAESLELAAERVTQVSGEELGKRADNINQTLESYKTNFEVQVKALQGELQSLREMNQTKFGNVDTAVSGLVKQTQALNNVLSSAQGRGNWGERMLEDILTQSGFKRGINYERQEILQSGGRPDYSFKLPPNRVLYLDSKFPLENYIKYHEALDDTTRRMHRDSFLKNVEARIKELEDRDYANATDALALDYVLLFIPNESVLGFIQQESPGLVDDAVRRRVVLCSPLTLYAFLSVVRQATDSFLMEQNANQVLGILNSFGKSWTTYVKYLNDMGKSFDKMQAKMKSLTSGRIYTTLKKNVDQIELLVQEKGIASSDAAVAELHAAFTEVDDDLEDL